MALPPLTPSPNSSKGAPGCPQQRGDQLQLIFLSCDRFTGMIFGRVFRICPRYDWHHSLCFAGNWPCSIPRMRSGGSRCGAAVGGVPRTGARRGLELPHPHGYPDCRSGASASSAGQARRDGTTPPAPEAAPSRVHGPPACRVLPGPEGRPMSLPADACVGCGPATSRARPSRSPSRVIRRSRTTRSRASNTFADSGSCLSIAGNARVVAEAAPRAGCDRWSRWCGRARVKIGSLGDPWSAGPGTSLRHRPPDRFGAAAAPP